MRILIAGNDANAYTLARMFSNNNDVDVVFAASGNKYISEFAECIDISDTDNEELLDFVVANEISLTVVTSAAAIENDIAGYFTDFRQNIFAPTFDAAFPTLYKSACKKLLYKLKVPTVKFGIFDRENQAISYVSDRRIPLLIKTDSSVNQDNPVLVNSFSQAKNTIEKIFMQPDNKVIIEDFTDAYTASVYFITDGYSALPIGSCSSDFDSNFSVISPDKVLSVDLMHKISDTVIYPFIDFCASKNTFYSGIIGVDLLVCDDEFSVIELKPFFKEIHLQSILPLLDVNLAELFLSVAAGSFSDEYNNIAHNNKCVYSKLVNSTIYKEKIREYDDENLSYSYSNNGKLILSQTAKTYSRAKLNSKSALLYLSPHKNSEKEASVASL